MQTEPYPARRPGDVDIGKGLRSADLTVASFQVNHDPVRPAVDRRFDYRGRSEVISGIATVSGCTPELGPPLMWEKHHIKQPRWRILPVAFCRVNDVA